MTTSSQPESRAELEAQIAETREELGATVEELSRKLDVKTRAKQKAAVTQQRAKERATIARDRAIVEVRAHQRLAAAATAALVVTALGAMVLWRRRS
jgi:hypothetical protein